MVQLAKFLDNYDTVIFDMDGVVTSEDNYWTCAALTVWELLFEDTASVSEMELNSKHIRKTVMCDDKLISLLKNKGVNSNWDLAYVIYAVCRIYDTTDFGKVMDICSEFGDNILNEYAQLEKELTVKTGLDGSRNGKIWTDIMLVFQEWFLGEKLFISKYNCTPKHSGKRGLIENEKPIIDNRCLIDIFSLLSSNIKRVAMATGRPGDEIIKPLERFGIVNYFSEDGLINYDYISNAENNLSVALSKPHPYIFLKAMLGNSYPDKNIIDGDFDKELINKTLIVGDAGADIIAAKAIGADFCAVLTGVSGKKAKNYFEELGAKYIFDSLEDFII